MQKPVLFAETCRSCLVLIVLKLAETVFASLHFRTLWPIWLNFFGHSTKKFGLWPKKERAKFACETFKGCP